MSSFATASSTTRFPIPMDLFQPLLRGLGAVEGEGEAADQGSGSEVAGAETDAPRRPPSPAPGQASPRTDAEVGSELRR